ncbi:MAG: MBL fold metallo-hydrolase [Verrucomicrobiaceae bacterium]|nr:MBL fold metallo-hydrolase [Verrucomicrobiaceae bacterium]
MIPAFQKDDALLADLASAPVAEDTLHVWWLGQSGFLVQWRGERMLFDPYLSDSLTKKYALTDKPHVRMTERCIDPARLTGITRVTASHVHTDHLDAETLVPMARENAGYRLYLPHPVVPTARQRLGLAHVTLCPLGEHNVYAERDWEIQATPAKHNEIMRDEEGNSHCIGFLVRCGPFRLFHSGDTLWDEEIITRCRAFGPVDVAFLPINGHKPERGVAGNLDGPEAAAMARAIGAQVVIPCHYEMFEFNTAPPDAFATACRECGQPFQVLRCGERLTMNAGV